MTLTANEHAQLEAKMQALKGAGQPFAMATVVRTVDATSARPGGKALLDHDGQILMGWIGGGCARGAVAKAARDAIRLGAPQFISLRPQELLETEGVAPGELREGVRYARNGCPSKGTMDVFVEPVLPLPKLAVCGAGLVAMALVEMGVRFDFDVTLCALKGTEVEGSISANKVEGFDPGAAEYIVVATQGQGDRDALLAALVRDTTYLSFVGSARKFAALAANISGTHSQFEDRLARVKAPAGLDIHAITPDEIALSILAEITQVRRARDMTKEFPDA